MALLTKSKYLAGLQCPKLLWTLINDKNSIPEVDVAQQQIFDTGNEVGVLATTLFKDGIKIPEGDFMGNINQTKLLLKKSVPLFEGGFMVDGLYGRVDILEPNSDGSWNIIEVKSSTQVKEVNIHDVSFQKYVYEKAGLIIKNCFLMYINNQYVKQGDLDVSEFFVKQDITSQVDEVIIGIGDRISSMKEIISSAVPKVSIGDYCSKPYVCALYDDCWNFLPENNVFTLSRGGKKSWKLFSEKIVLIKDIPSNFELSPKQQLQKDVVSSEKTHINKEGIKHFLAGLKYPIFYFDFETINPAIPFYDGMKPYQRIAFQYSLHVQEVEGGELKHISFLADEKADPRIPILKSMQEHLGSAGTILTWNQSFEKGIIRELGEMFSEHVEWCDGIIDRIDDLMIPFSNYFYYNAVQQGSVSIKKVLPALTDLSYKDLEINNGSNASSVYQKLCLNDLPKSEVEKIRKNLEIYCELDTFAEVKILDALIDMVK